jgi:hypothetical protein
MILIALDVGFVTTERWSAPPANPSFNSEITPPGKNECAIHRGLAVFANADTKDGSNRSIGDTTSPSLSFRAY